MRFVTGLPMRPGEVKTYPTHVSHVSKKTPRRPRHREPRDRNDWLLRNGSEEQAQESARIARQRQGERED